MSVPFEPDPPIAWDAEEIGLLRRLVDAGVSVADGSDCLGCGMGDYRQKMQDLGLRLRMRRGRRDCLMCGLAFTSPHLAFVKVCDDCKASDQWRFAGAWGVNHLRHGVLAT